MKTKYLTPILILILSSCTEKEPNVINVSSDYLDLIKSIDEDIEKAKADVSRLDSLMSHMKSSNKGFKFQPGEDHETSIEDSFLLDVMMSSDDVSNTPK